MDASEIAIQVLCCAFYSLFLLYFMLLLLLSMWSLGLLVNFSEYYYVYNRGCN